MERGGDLGRPFRAGPLCALLAVVALAALAGASKARADGAPLPPQGPAPAQTNAFSCRPSPRHPYPVVLVHGTFGNMAVSWNSIVPALKRLGYCVFALDYGNSPLPGINGVGDIPTSARQLQTFVDQVLTATGASKVSIVGHSQGGMLPRYLIKFLGATGKVDDLVGLSPSSHGTTTPLAGPAGLLGCTACAQQVAGSAFMNQLNAGDQAPAPVSYTVVETDKDEVVTPYNSEFLPPTADGRVTNVLLQDRCPRDLVEHLGIIYDPVAIQWMLSALGRPGPADPQFSPDCSAAALASFPDSSSVAAASGGTGSGGTGSGGRGTGSGGAAGLLLGKLRRSGSRASARKVSILVRAFGQPVRRPVVKVRKGGAKGKVVARSGRFDATGYKRVALRLPHGLAGGRYLADAQGRDGAGRIVHASLSFGLR